MKIPSNLLRVLILAAVVLMVATSPTQAQKTRRRTAASGPPTLSLTAEPNVVRVCEGQAATVQLLAHATAASGNQIRYRWTVDGGSLSGTGATTAWDLTGSRPGTYHAVADVDEGDEYCASFASVGVVVLDCPPPPPPPPACPEVRISCPDNVTEKAPVTFSATISGGTPGVAASYNWTVTNGHILSGQGTSSITVDTAGLAGQ